MRYFKLILCGVFIGLLCSVFAVAQTPLGPGVSITGSSEASPLKTGSVLVYGLYSSGATSGNAQNTRISMTNTGDKAALIHLYFVSGNNGLAAGVYVCLSGRQTTTFFASDLDPGITGYILAFAVDENGCPSSYNFLAGNAAIKLSSGHNANYNAMAFAALFTGTLPGCDPLGITARLAFDGVAYNRAPRVVALDKVRSTADGNATLFVLNRLDGDMLSGMPPLGGLNGTLFDETGAALPFTATANSCQLVVTLANTFPATTPNFTTAIPAGRSGWLQVFATSDTALFGLGLNFNSNVSSARTAFTGGGTLDTLTVTGTGGFTVRVFPPSC